MTDKELNMETGWKLSNSYATLSENFYTEVKPTPVSKPKIVAFNNSLAEVLGLNGEELQRDNLARVFSGNQLIKGSLPIAQAYAGHQFGYFTMLGDGRAILLGEQLTPKGERLDIQLKGSGRTPYSRGGDGRAALGPMLREYIISEAMYFLGIPTTRSLAVVTTGDAVIREAMLPGAILTRVAASHIRVGTFEYASKWCSTKELRELADYTIQRHYPEVLEGEKPYLSFLREVIKRQAMLLAKWMQVGFIHGVMNTDNMTISGETIDYGPCAFMDTYDPQTVFSSIDRNGRYAYGNQPTMAAWNLARFAEALLPLIDENTEKAVQIAQEEISAFMELYHNNWLKGMRGKLGLFNEELEDEMLIKNLLSMMEKYGGDYTNTFRALTLDKLEDTSFFDASEFAEWYELWQSRLSRQQESRESIIKLMRNSNPGVIPRNHRVEEALEAAVEHGDFSVLHRLLEVVSTPYTHNSDQVEYCTLPRATNRPYKTFCGT